MFAGLSSIPLALVGGIVLGALQQLIAAHLPLNSVLARNIRPSMPFILLLRCCCSSRPAAHATSPIRCPVSTHPRPRSRSRTWTRGWPGSTGSCSSCSSLAVCLAVIFVLPGLWVSYLAEGLALTTIFLSITVLVGIGGQISLCQASFAGLGAFTAGQLATRWDFPLYGGIIVGALVAAALGVLIALPCIRLGGLYLALGTLAFALMFQNTLVRRVLVDGVGRGCGRAPAVDRVDRLRRRPCLLLLCVRGVRHLRLRRRVAAARHDGSVPRRAAGQ